MNEKKLKKNLEDSLFFSPKHVYELGIQIRSQGRGEGEREEGRRGGGGVRRIGKLWVPKRPKAVQVLFPSEPFKNFSFDFFTITFKTYSTSLQTFQQVLHLIWRLFWGEVKLIAKRELNSLFFSQRLAFYGLWKKRKRNYQLAVVERYKSVFNACSQTLNLFNLSSSGPSSSSVEG